MLQLKYDNILLVHIEKVISNKYVFTNRHLSMNVFYLKKLTFFKIFFKKLYQKEVFKNIFIL